MMMTTMVVVVVVVLLLLLIIIIILLLLLLSSSSSSSSSSSNVELGHLLICSGLTSRSLFDGDPWFLLPVVCSCLVLLVIYYGVFCLYVATNFFYILVFYPKLVLYLVLLQSLCLFYNLSKCILLFFSLISSLLLLFFLLLLLEWSYFHYHRTEVEGLVYCIDREIDRFTLGSSPYSPDAPRPYRRALCAP